MEYTEVIYLISQRKEEDDIGNYITSSNSSKKIYAKKQSVKTNEFYNAIQVGITPSIEFVIKKSNYSGEKEIEWSGDTYQITRVIEPKNKFDIVLVCSKKIGL